MADKFYRLDRVDGGVSIMRLPEGHTADDLQEHIVSWEATGFVLKKCTEVSEEEAGRVKTKRNAADWRNNRLNAYPNMGDQLDAILKGFNQLRLEGQNLPADLDGVVNEWLAVKKKFPKPDDEGLV